MKHKTKFAASLFATLAMLTFSCTLQTLGQNPREPIIDMHFHALPITWLGPIDSIPWMHLPIKMSRTNDLLMTESIGFLRKNNIVKAVASGPLKYVTKWKEAAPDLIIPGLLSNLSNLNIDSLQSYVRSGRVQVLGEVTAQYSGLAPNDPSYEKYFAAAELLQIPIAWHMGLGPPGASYEGKYRSSLSSALNLDEVLARHQKIRMYIMHAGWPMQDDMIAIMYAYPQLYVDVAVINWYISRKEFHTYLKRLVDAGFGKRIMFGSDQMVWPESIQLAIEGIESANFLTKEEKRDIFYNNAARFLRLSQDDIKRDHQQRGR